MSDTDNRFCKIYRLVLQTYIEAQAESDTVLTNESRDALIYMMREKACPLMGRLSGGAPEFKVSEDEIRKVLDDWEGEA